MPTANVQAEIRSMTGFAAVKGESSGGGFTLSLKSVNHRFLDLHFRMPADRDLLELAIRRVLKEKLARGHVDVTLSLGRKDDRAATLNRELVGNFVSAFRAAASEFSLHGEPDLNTILRLPGVMEGGSVELGEDFDPAVMAALELAIAQLNEMRELEGKSTTVELRIRMERLQAAADGVGEHRGAVVRAYMEKVSGRMAELLGRALSGNGGNGNVNQDRLIQEAALLADRSDIQEEIQRLTAHIQHFLGVLNEGGEAGKKLDFLLQEMNREANTLLSKTSGLAGEALTITELGLAMKAEIEKSREQVQNIE